MVTLLSVIGTTPSTGEAAGRFLAYWFVITLALVVLLVGTIVITVLRRSTRRLREVERKAAALRGNGGPDPWEEAGRRVRTDREESEA